MPLGLVLRHNVDPVAGFRVNLKPIFPLCVIRQLRGIGGDVEDQFSVRHIQIVPRPGLRCINFFAK